MNGSGGGLISSTSDQATRATWGCYGTTIVGADGEAIGTGIQNTIDIETDCTSSGTAADICANLTIDGYSDWFLPSKSELNLMYENIGNGNALGLGNVGNFTSNWYWSSTEEDSNSAWYQSFSNNFLQYFINKNNTYGDVRAIRAFGNWF